jgi:hypothetical protein
MSVFSVSQIGSQIDREINAEVRSHIEMRTADIIAAGMPPEKARRDALLKFGNPTVMRERVAGVDFALNLDIFFRDVQYAFRKLRKTPAFAITVILGIGGPSVYQSCELPGCRQTAPYAWGGIPVIRQGPCDAPEKPCQKPTSPDSLICQRRLSVESLSE